MSFHHLLNDTCTFSARVESVDEETGEQIFTRQTVAENVPCAFQNGGGGLDRNNRLITGSNSDRLYLFPLDFEIKKTVHIVTVRGRDYRISAVQDMGGRKRYLRLNLERTALNE